MLELKRRSPSWWDGLKVPPATPAALLFSWLEEVSPLPEEHDYVLSTDGSGCTKGWGASASIIQKVEPGGVLGRQQGSYQPLISATYGSTVQRRELSALVDGLHEILRLEMLAASGEPCEDDGEMLPNWMKFTGDGRITVLWYTDRSNLAKSLLFDETGVPLNRRTSESDLWMRYSTMARFFCITPMWHDRNAIRSQAVCDALCSSARNAIIAAAPEFGEIMNNAIHPSWNKQRSQKAVF